MKRLTRSKTIESPNIMQLNIIITHRNQLNRTKQCKCSQQGTTSALRQQPPAADRITSRSAIFKFNSFKWFLSATSKCESKSASEMKTANLRNESSKFRLQIDFEMLSFAEILFLSLTIHSFASCYLQLCINFSISLHLALLCSVVWCFSDPILSAKAQFVYRSSIRVLRHHLSSLRLASLCLNFSILTTNQIKQGSSSQRFKQLITKQ